MPRGINNYTNAQAIYANPNWKYYSPYMRNLVVLFNSKKMPFFIKNGKRQSFNKRPNTEGNNRLFYGPGQYNYLMNTPASAKNVFAHYEKFKNSYGLTKRSLLKNTVAAYRVRMVKKRAQNKLNAAQAKRVNKLANNVRADRNISKARLPNLVALVMRYQHPNAGAYYHHNNKGRVVNNYGKKPTRKQLLANINNFKKYNFFA